IGQYPPMTVSDVADHLARGEEALRSGRWAEARDAFKASLADSASPEAVDGLGRALWWIGETGEALATRGRAYSAYRKVGRVGEAARVAIWLGLEHAASPGHEAVAGGWLSRAERLLDGSSSPESGWLSLARAGLETDPIRMADRADEALAAAREFGDAELEIRALAKTGLALVQSGRVDEGMAHLDEAMAAASAGEAEKPETFAETCCDMVAACEAALDGRRLEQWGRVAEQFMEVRPYAPLVAFCGSCCAGVFAARGDLASAERWLIWTIEKLENGGHEARCVDPRARLAELRISQGRFEEAERLLSGIESRPESIRPVVALHMERGELAPAASVLHRRLRKMGSESVGAVPFLAMLVTVQIARGDIGGAISSAHSIERLAKRTGDDRNLAESDLATGRVLLAQGNATEAVEALSSAVERFDRLKMRLDSGRARLDLGEALAATGETELAVNEVRAASAGFEKIGAVRQADKADALLRSLGERGRVGPKGVGRLTRRELEVLELLSEGLTNAEIAQRLFISTKTAGNHVSNILMKLNLRSRTEAVAFALRPRS
ncbi:MAG TPA: LuxR C-terminal-related transcriptional regulator, partial [Acidimicrobiia bacterium]